MYSWAPWGSTDHDHKAFSCKVTRRSSRQSEESLFFKGNRRVQDMYVLEKTMILKYSDVADFVRLTYNSTICDTA